MRIIECEQGSVSWWMARAGTPSASNFDRIITPKTGKLSAQAMPYICELIAERVMGGPPEGVEAYTSRAMQYGVDTEPEARAYYELESGVKVQQVGFIFDDSGRFGCSPDGLVGDDGGLELKCPMAKTHVAYLLAGELPTEYRCQVHSSLLVTGRKWWDFMSYCIGFSPFIIRVVPDAFTAAMATALAEFLDMYDACWKQIEPNVIRSAEAAIDFEDIMHQPF